MTSLTNYDNQDNSSNKDSMDISDNNSLDIVNNVDNDSDPLASLRSSVKLTSEESSGLYYLFNTIESQKEVGITKEDIMVNSILFYCFKFLNRISVGQLLQTLKLD
jgi:hypothetical protein